MFFIKEWLYYTFRLISHTQKKGKNNKGCFNFVSPLALTSVTGIAFQIAMLWHKHITMPTVGMKLEWDSISGTINSLRGSGEEPEEKKLMIYKNQNQRRTDVKLYQLRCSTNHDRISSHSRRFMTRRGELGND